MLSVIIITKNEEANIRRCLDSVHWAEEIIVVDSGSTDNTLEIAKEYTDKVYTKDWPGYGIQKQRALELATQTWVLNLDADEVVDESLKKAIESAINQNEFFAYRIPIHLHFYNKSMHYSWSPKNHVRLFKREGTRYSDKIVHEAIILPAESKIGHIKTAIQHYCLQDISHAIAKMNYYSSCSAKINLEKNKTPSFIKIILSSWWMFIRCYFIQGGILDGKDGFVLAVLSAQGSFYRGIKTLYPDQDFV